MLQQATYGEGSRNCNGNFPHQPRPHKPPSAIEGFVVDLTTEDENDEEEKSREDEEVNKFLEEVQKESMVKEMRRGQEMVDNFQEDVRNVMYHMGVNTASSGGGGGGKEEEGEEKGGRDAEMEFVGGREVTIDDDSDGDDDYDGGDDRYEDVSDDERDVKPKSNYDGDEDVKEPYSQHHCDSTSRVSQSIGGKSEEENVSMKEDDNNQERDATMSGKGIPVEEVDYVYNDNQDCDYVEDDDFEDENDNDYDSSEDEIGYRDKTKMKPSQPTHARPYRSEEVIEIELDDSSTDSASTNADHKPSHADHQSSNTDTHSTNINYQSTTPSTTPKGPLHVVDLMDDSDDDIEIIGVEHSHPPTFNETRQGKRRREVERVNEMKRAAYENIERQSKGYTAHGSGWHDNPNPTMGRQDANRRRWGDVQYNAQMMREQERLLRESADRCRERDLRMRQAGVYFLEPVKDLATLPDQHWKSPNLYTRLGLPYNSSFTLVKKHYRKLCLLYHPDKAKCADAPSRFQGIKEAYESLADRPNY